VVAGALPLEPLYWRKQIWLQIEDKIPSACHLHHPGLRGFLGGSNKLINKR
jgi:hypothetical protein